MGFPVLSRRQNNDAVDPEARHPLAQLQFKLKTTTCRISRYGPGTRAIDILLAKMRRSSTTEVNITFGANFQVDIPRAACSVGFLTLWLEISLT